MKGSLVKWIHDDLTNICVIIREHLNENNDDPEINELWDPTEENPLFMCYDFVTNEIFFATLDELNFI